MIRLARYPSREKDDVIAWEGMPLGRCNMNFRPPNSVSRNDRTTWKILCITSLITSSVFVLAMVFCAVVPLGLAYFIFLAFLIVIACGEFLRSKFSRQTTNRPTLIAAFILIVACELLARFQFPNSKAVLFVGCLGLVIVPYLACFFDSLATHYVHWISSSPKLDSRTLKVIRLSWSQRFKNVTLPRYTGSEGLAGDTQQINQLLQLGQCHSIFLLLAALAIVVPAILTMSITQFSPLAVLVVISIVLIGLMTIVGIQFPGVLTIVFDALKHFLEFHHQKNRSPPWVFQSPAGSSIGRQHMVFGAIMMLNYFVNACWFSVCSEIAGFEIVEVPHWTSIAVGLFIYLLVSLLLTPVLFFSALTISVGPVLWAHHQLCEGKTALLWRTGWSEFDIYTDRLRHSRNPNERNAVWVGFHKTLGFPVLLDIALIREHMHILGATGSGKTGLGITTLVSQLIRRNDGPVIILDCKGDRNLLHSAHAWSRETKRKFKWFTTTSGKSSYIFNPFDQKHLSSMTLQELVGFFLLALNLSYGPGYGRSWFAAVGKAVFLATVKESKEKPPQTFAEIQNAIELLISENKEYDAAKHLMFVMRSLAEFRQLNLNHDTNEDPACKHAIHMPEVIEEKQVVYFNLESLTDSASAGEISRLVTYSAISAARDYQERTGKPANVYLVIDEAQNVVAANISNVLEQARSCGLTCILAHQTLSQLNTPDVDLREVVTNCTASKLYFSCRDPDTKKYLSAISGEVAYYTAGWKQFVHRVQEGVVGMHRAVGFNGEHALADVTEKVGPRLADDELSEASRSSNQCVIAVERYEGLSRFRGAFPIHVDYPITQKVYKERTSRTPWPSAPGETIETPGFWPAQDSETVVTSIIDPKIGDQVLTIEQLDELKAKFDEGSRKHFGK